MSHEVEIQIIPFNPNSKPLITEKGVKERHINKLVDLNTWTLPCLAVKLAWFCINSQARPGRSDRPLTVMVAVATHPSIKNCIVPRPGRHLEVAPPLDSIEKIQFEVDFQNFIRV